MKVTNYNYEFELVKCTRIYDYKFFSSELDKTDFIRNHKKNTYELINHGYAVRIYQYSIIDLETGYCINNNKPLSYNECLELIRMYC